VPAHRDLRPSPHRRSAPPQRAKQFQDIVDKYPPHAYRRYGALFRGINLSKLNDNAGGGAQSAGGGHSSNADLSALGKFALASVYRGENKDTQAIDLYKQLIDKPTLVVSKATAQIELAGFYESRQKADEAKRIYEQVAKKIPPPKPHRWPSAARPRSSNKFLSDGLCSGEPSQARNQPLAILDSCW